MLCELEEIKQKWAGIEFTLVQDEEGIICVREVDIIFEALDETLSQVNMILGSRFVKPLRDTAEKQKKIIQDVAEMVDELLKCQRQFMYLRNIFIGSADI